jgi:hypothetical protein
MTGIARSSAGSQGLTNTVAEQAEIVAAQMIDWWYSDDANLIPKITNSSVKSLIEAPGQKIVFIQEPEAQVNAYLRDAPISWTSLTPIRTEITVDYAYLSAHKLDAIDEYEIKVPLLQKIGTTMGKKHAEKEAETFFNVAPTLSFLSRLIIDNGATGPVVTSRSGYEAGADGGTYIFGQLSSMRTKFNRGRVPKNGRYVVVSPEVEEILMNSDQATWSVSGKTNTEMETGEYGLKICGFDVLVSEFIPGDGSTGNPYKCLVGQKDCIGFGRRVQKVDLNVKLQDYMATGHRSLNYFGFGALNMRGLGLWKVRTH